MITIPDHLLDLAESCSCCEQCGFCEAICDCPAVAGGHADARLDQSAVRRTPAPPVYLPVVAA